MRLFIGSLVGFVTAVMLGATSVASAGVMEGCRICTCQNEAIICLAVKIAEVLEEQGVCASPCASVDSSFKSTELIETPCEDLPACDHADTPAASPLWLSAGALALALLGGMTLRRFRPRTAQ